MGLLDPAISRAEILLANTWICNLRCTYCFVQENGIADQNQVMSPEMAQQVMDALDSSLPYVKEINLHRCTAGRVSM